MEISSWIDYINLTFLVYAVTLLAVYFISAVLAVSEFQKYNNKNRYVDYKSMLNHTRLPSVTIIAPAYNESKTIIENINCLLALQYPNFEILIINDGSKDDSLQKVIDYFQLIEVKRTFETSVKCKPIKAIYKSINNALNHLYLIDKENGGKADALNAGINISKSDLFLALDVDCIIEPDAILKMVKPFLDDNNRVVIASGGVVRVANSCEIVDGKVIKVNYPANFWAKFQVLEYFRAFTMGRMAWTKLNGLLIISGAFGLFDRERVIKVGGYDISTVGEDLELVVRLRRYMHEVEKKKYKVAFIPDPLCWTEVPEEYGILARQRNRWTRGGIDTILKHKKMFLNPKYGIVGLLSFPYWVLFEWLAPILQFFGFIYLVIITIFGYLHLHTFLMLIGFVLAFSIMYSLFAIFLEAYTFNKYVGKRYAFQSFAFIFLEMIIYQPLNMYFAVKGNYDYFFTKNQKGWGVMTRKGFTKS